MKMASMDLTQSGVPESEISIPDTDFVFDLLRQCLAGARGKNVICEPLSITTGLAMACMGACGNTAEEIRQVLKWSTDVPPTSFGSYPSSLEEKTTQKTTGSTLIKAQRLYVDGSFTLKPKFSSDLLEHFASQPVAADFKNNPEGERENINGWMLQQTQSQIHDLLPEGAIDSSTSMLLAQGSYFQGIWKYEFDPRNTYQSNFFTPSETVQVYMMHQTREFGYGHILGTPAVELPYTNTISGEDGDLGMVILLPKNQEELEKLEEELTENMLIELVAELSPVNVDLKLPRFSDEQTIGLKPPLTRLGLRQAFGEDADFSGMIEEGQMHVESIFHRVKVYTNEEGTEVQVKQQHVAANSSGGTMTDKGVVEADPEGTEEVAEEQVSAAAASTVKEMPMTDATPFYVDHPFLIFIAEKKPSSGSSRSVAVHLAGRVVNPH